MKTVRRVCFDDFVSWYLERELRKPCTDAFGLGTMEEMRQLMRTMHPGKVRDWFSEADWWIVELESVVELGSLLFLDDAQTRGEGLVKNWSMPNYRLLAQVARNAISRDYLSLYPEGSVARYHRDIDARAIKLNGPDRLVLCELDAVEKETNPRATYYLHDGAARGLACMLLLRGNRQAVRFPIEAFMCERKNAR